MKNFELLSVECVDINGLGELFINFNLYKNKSNGEWKIIFAEKPIDITQIQVLIKDLFPFLEFETTGHQWLFNHFKSEYDSNRIFKIHSYIELNSNLLILICSQYKSSIIELSF